MGDVRRFRLFASIVQELFPARKKMKIADVAGGAGNLGRRLRELGYHHTVTIDRRVTTSNARWRKLRQMFRYNQSEKFDLVVGMHPDEATDHIILYAKKHRIPFVICPCCIKPDAAVYSGGNNKREWIKHLQSLAGEVKTKRLPMAGDNLVLYRLSWS